MGPKVVITRVDLSMPSVLLMFIFDISEYSFMVESLADEFRVLSSRYLNSVYEPDPIPSGSESDCSTASDESNHQKHKSGVPDPRKRGGLMKLAQAFSGSGNRSNPKSTTTAASKVKLKTEDVWDTPSPDSSEPDSKNRKTNKPKVVIISYVPEMYVLIFIYSYRKRLIKKRARSRNLLLEVEILKH